MRIKKLLRALLSRNLSLHIFLLDACINDIQKIVMSDRMMVRTLKRSIIHHTHLSINQDVRNVTKMAHVVLSIMLISDDATMDLGKEAQFEKYVMNPK